MYECLHLYEFSWLYLAYFCHLLVSPLEGTPTGAEIMSLARCLGRGYTNGARKAQVRLTVPVWQGLRYCQGIWSERRWLSQYANTPRNACRWVFSDICWSLVVCICEFDLDNAETYRCLEPFAMCSRRLRRQSQYAKFSPQTKLWGL